MKYYIVHCTRSYALNFFVILRQYIILTLEDCSCKRVGCFFSPAPGVFKQTPCKAKVLSLDGDLSLSMISLPPPFYLLSSHAALLATDQSNNLVLMLLLNIMSTKVESLHLKA